MIDLFSSVSSNILSSWLSCSPWPTTLPILLSFWYWLDAVHLIPLSHPSSTWHKHCLHNCPMLKIPAGDESIYEYIPFSPMEFVLVSKLGIAINSRKTPFMKVLPILAWILLQFNIRPLQSSDITSTAIHNNHLVDSFPSSSHCQSPPYLFLTYSNSSSSVIPLIACSYSNFVVLLSLPTCIPT